MSDDLYKKLLDKAFSKLPPTAIKKDRFEMPRPSSSISGNRTILYNAKEISDRLRRDREHILKFLAGELATAGTVDGTHIIFQGKFDNKTIEQLLEKYTQEFVLCPICHQPDTRITREERLYFLVCDACGAKSSLRGI